MCVFVVELVITFRSPLDAAENLENATSFMQTDLGASKVQELCSDVLSSVKNAAGFSCEMLAAVDMAVLQIPPSAGTNPDLPGLRLGLSLVLLSILICVYCFIVEAA